MAGTLLIDAGDDSLLIDGDRIVALGQDALVVGEGVERLAAGEGAVVRGAEVNAHTHLYSGLAGLGMPPPQPAPENFVQILERVWWKLDRALDAASLRAAARLYVAEALLAGTTALIDHHESPVFLEGSLDVLADAAQELGCRLATGYGATERNGGRDEARRGLEECRRFALANKRPLVRPLVALHASFTVSDRTISEAGDLCRELGIPMHVHVAEDQADTLDAHKRGYEGAYHRLAKLDALPPGSILAHGVDLDDPAVHVAETNGLWLVQNPRSNRGNRVGWPYALSATTRVALGTDGYPATMREEWVAAADGMIENADRRAAEDPEILLRRRHGAHRIAAERFGAAFGSHPESGHAADIAIHSAPGGTSSALATVLEDVDLFRARRRLDPAIARPRHVVSAGRLVVRDGRLLTGDEAAIRAEASEQAARLWSRMGAL